MGLTIRRAFAAALTFAFALAVASCGDENSSVLPTGPARLSTEAITPGTCTTIDALKALAASAMGSGSPNVNSVTGKLDNIQQQLSINDLAEARAHAVDLIDFLLKKSRDKHFSGSQADVQTLINKILCYVGVSVTTSNLTDIWIVAPGDAPQTLVNSTGTAGVSLSGDNFAEPTVVTIESLSFTPPPSAPPGAGPLNTKLDQYTGPAYIDISATSPLVNPAIVGVCPPTAVPADVRARLRLGHQTSSGFEITPSANASFLRCAPSSVTSLSSSDSRRSSVGSSSNEGQPNIPNARFFLDAEATGGVGGLAGSFSPFDAVDPLLEATGGVGGTAGTFTILTSSARMNLVAGGLRTDLLQTCPTQLPVGSSVTPECRPTVTIKTHLGTPLQNVPVSFAVTQGGGTAAPSLSGSCGTFGSLALVATDATGKSRICWTLGSEQGTNTVVATPGTGGDAPAGVSYTTSTLSFTITTTDQTPPAISDPVVQGDLGTNGWYVSNVTISWSAADAETGIASTSGCNVTLATDTEGQEFTCSATNGAGLTSTKSVTVKRDATTPTVTVTKNGPPGLNGWYTGDVALAWNITTGPSAVATSTPDCGTNAVTQDGTFSFTCSVTSGAGLSGSASVDVKRDASAPEISGPHIDGQAGDDGWYVSNVSLSWAASDPQSDISSTVGCGGFVGSDTPGTAFTCVATNGAGLSSSKSFTVKRDATIPTVTVSESGTPGLNGWYTGDVALAWDVTTGPSGIRARSDDCGIDAVTHDGTFSFTCTIRSGAGLSGGSSVDIKRDASFPTVIVSKTGTLGDNGWYVSDVAIIWGISANGPSGIGATTADCSITSITADGAFALACTATSGAGLSSEARESGKRDVTKPVITYSGNLGTYTVDQTVNISCSAFDATSGVASTSCANVSRDAYLFSLGSNGISSTATDYAGNVGRGETSFTLTATYGSVCSLTRRFATNANIANALCVKLTSAESAAARGNAQAKAGALGAFVNQVRAETGETLTAAQASLLINFAGAL